MEFWLASYPRSGNSYLRILLRNRFGVPSIDQECPEEMETATLRGTRIARAHHRGEDAPPDVIGLKSHKPPEPGDTRPGVYIVRDGRDALVSYAHFAMSFVYKDTPGAVSPERLRDTIRDMILEPNSPYWTWSRNVEAWVARPNTVVIRFEDLIADPGKMADLAMAGIGLQLPVISDVIPTFRELKAVDPQFFRRGQRGEWQEVFTRDLYDIFWENSGSTMEKFGYLHLPPARPDIPASTEPQPANMPAAA